MRVWIDLANSPHPLLFEPIVSDLVAAGHEPLISARDHAQTADLARERFEGVEVLGNPSPAGTLAKGRAVAAHAAALRRLAVRFAPDVALSHNSYAQILAARSAGTPVVTAMDYEHQPANHLAFRLAHRVLVPEALPWRRLARQGAGNRRLVRYAGFKEDIYLGEKEPDPGVLESVGLEPTSDEAVVLARSAPAGATYHPDENPLFEQCIRALDAQTGVRTVVLARHAHQRQRLRSLELERTTIPERAVDARSLLFRADAFVGAGGTMTREAALLGVPAFSLFAGRLPAVDIELEALGLLRRLERPEQLRGLVPRERGSIEPALDRLRSRGAAIRQKFVEAIEVVGAPDR